MAIFRVAGVMSHAKELEASLLAGGEVPPHTPLETVSSTIKRLYGVW